MSERNGKPDRKAGTQSHGTHRVSRATETKGIVMLVTTKILGALAVAGLVAASGSAFTSSGITQSGTGALGAGFAGGTVSQNVHGADLSAVQYTAKVGSSTLVHSATLTFNAIPEDQSVAVVVNGITASPITCDRVLTSEDFACALGDVALDTLDVTVKPIPPVA